MSDETTVDLRLHRTRLSDARVVDVDIADGRVIAVTPSGEGPAPGGASDSGPPATELDLDGYLLLPAPAEPHAHLDKALTADVFANPTGDLLGAIEVWRSNRPDLTVEEIADRAERAARINLAHGITAIRTHIDVSDLVGTTSAEALIAVRDRIGHLIDIQIAGLVSTPSVGEQGGSNRRALLDTLELGIDVVGGCPHLEELPEPSIRAALEDASRFDRPVDLHMDETLDPAVLDLVDLAHLVIDTGFEGRVTASHCVSLGVQPPEVQEEVARLTAEAGIGVIALPQTNLFLQARGVAVGPARGLTPVATLRGAGVTVAAGADNLQDPFNTMGRGDPLETAALMVMVGHMTPEDAYDAVSATARTVMGLETVAIEPGRPAEFLAVRAGSLREAIASAPADRVVIHRGRVVSRSVATVEQAD